MVGVFSKSPLFCLIVGILTANNFLTGAFAEMNLDGGRSELPGMKQDIFDQMAKIVV